VKIKKNLRAPTAAATQNCAQALDGLSDIRFGENIGYDRPRVRDVSYDGPINRARRGLSH
jgi:hypothetical protein